MNNQPNNHNQPIRNINGFLKSYLQSESGKKNLNKGPHKGIWQNGAMAHAFSKAVNA